ncbi:hypothetical protein PENTCL1PPCAC_17436 [Pristionchus entomophagus]|uniref:TLC domain-containing protein n=1 Tax=Pristionchus entomophagus TaxID=358040 RepID=A0AAV5TLP9_9BILA|nr:hypothetical protein PENTCL1PPCAC_17436 [Pristionchus entomophagus]
MNLVNSWSSGHTLWPMPCGVSRTSSQSQTDMTKLWLNYPEEHRTIPMKTKFFFIIQLAYWHHSFPEFYLQKYKGDEMKERTTPILIHIVAIAAGYALNFNRITLVLVALEALVGLIFHAARFLHIIECKNTSSKLFRIFNIIFVISRVMETLLAAVVFWHGFKVNEDALRRYPRGNFNTSFIRLNALFGVVVLQGYQFALFALFHFGRIRESWSKKTKKTQANPPVNPKNVKTKKDE